MRLNNVKARIKVEVSALKRTLWQTVLSVFGFSAVPLKHRHVFTRDGQLRIRYIVFILAGFLGFVTSFSNNDHKTYLGTNDMVVADFDNNQDAINIPPLPPEAIDPATLDNDGIPKMPTRKPMVALVDNWTRNILIQTGDTIPSLLDMAGYDRKQAKDGANVLEDYITTKDLVAGGSMEVIYQRNPTGAPRILSIAFPESDLSSIVLKQNTKGGFIVSKITKQLQRELRAVRVKIRSALYNDLSKAGVPHSMIIELIKAYSYSVDFARDIWAGDTVEVLYDVDATADGSFVRGNDLLMVKLTLRGRENEIVRFAQKNGAAEFFDGKGKTIRRAFLQTPIDGARITSGFGMRRHPIQGYNKMHKGVDFGAPTGTPVFGAGDGTIERAGWVSGYGNYIKLKHNGTFSTAYAHLSRFAKGIRNGTRVRQGQVIAYVGSTGNSTGPHLHFELIKNGQQINPRDVANISLNNGLSGTELRRFTDTRNGYWAKFRSLLNGGVAPVVKTTEPITTAAPIVTNATVKHPQPTRKPQVKSTQSKSKTKTKTPVKKKKE